MMYWDSGWSWLWMAATMLVFWGLVAWVIVALVRRPPGYESRSDARDILDVRFARGEIDAEEYAERRRILGLDRTRAEHNPAP